MHYRRAVIPSHFGVSGRLLIILILSILEKESGADGSVSIIDKSLCKRYHRVTATRRVSYRETFMSDDDWRYPSIVTRINFRTEDYTKWDSVEMCCDGYEPHQQAADATKCVPVCLSDCINGTCLHPNLCTCNDGYRMEINKLTEYSECVPICPSGCRGGSCIGPHTCSCDFGYLLAKDQGSCEALCTDVGGPGPQGCVGNSSCIAPNTCECDDGYTAVTIYDFNRPLPSQQLNTSTMSCQPKCETECGKNSSCVAPNKCQCKPGYSTTSMSEHGTNDSQCIPICKQTCFNGFCESPNKCKCLEGHKPHQFLDEDFCEPICKEECVNAKCIKPNQCDCVDGYEKLIVRNGQDERASDNVCTPVCPGQCPNGVCVSPGQCRCNTGYVLDLIQPNGTKIDVASNTSSSNPLDHLSQQSCRPLCEPSCPKGLLCIAPNQCQFETKRDQDFKDFAKISTEIVNYTEDCGNNGLFYKENGTCVCDYHLDGRRCTVPALCAKIFTDHTKDDKKFIALQHIVFLNNSPGPRNGVFDWEGSRCTDKCRISIDSKKSLEVVNEKTDHCYLLEAYNEITGIISTTMRPLSLSSSRENDTLICFVRAEPTCSTIESKMGSGQFGGVVGGIVGTILLLALIVGLVVVIYLARRKIRKIGAFGAISRSNGNIMEQSETMESPLHTVDSSHL